MSRKSKAAEFVNQGYDITVTGRNVLVTDAMKDYAIEKFSKIDRFEMRIVDATITMDIQKHDHRVDMMVKVNDQKIKSSASSDDMYASIDRAADKLQSQLRRYKTKIQDRRAHPLEVIDMRVNVLRSPANEDLMEINDEIEDLNQTKELNGVQHQHIATQETRPLKTLTPDEALTKIDLSGDQFLIFRNEIDRKISVIYRRNDGNYGLIEVE